MYKQLDHLLSAETTVDSWYDDGCVIATEILEGFNPDDWHILSREAWSKPLNWQKKLAYCLDSTREMHEFELLLSLMTIEDRELFVICIDTLRSYTSPEHKQRLMHEPLLLERVAAALSGAGIAERRVLEDFLRGLII
ncbi:hypothetical protein M3629_16415 [Paenibacillus polysaccharolyticus]|uniref:hypothetical protein n=1 Tax=Paenibacillus polysaccharolyticus TaxID=582692 RepID=UPI002040DBB8|nr:hypothetical protein [Paenibacillus polysaccharolyticus]MCM3134379.1 hypothetical protein [Paenibacillus polysaccharolyticus]